MYKTRSLIIAAILVCDGYPLLRTECIDGVVWFHFHASAEDAVLERRADHSDQRDRDIIKTYKSLANMAVDQARMNRGAA
jgi:hypothetical protein